MIPLHLRVSGFLSYRDPAELDFQSFDLACISGRNGAGKSALLDAITFALFGQARKRDESVVNLQSKAAEVTLTFEYEGAVYRVQRSLARGKSAALEFQIRGAADWKPLTERTLRETQARIESTLSLDYETFINASFFLQGQADHFARQNAGRRKEVLGNILGLEVWDTFRSRASDRRRGLENELAEIDGRLDEIAAELAEESARKQRLEELSAHLELLTTARGVQESAVERIAKAAAILAEQRKLVSTLSDNAQRSRLALAGLQQRLAEKEAERDEYRDILARAQEIEAAYQAWQSNRLELETWNQIASTNLEFERQRAPLLEQIAAERARLEQEQRTLQIQAKAIEDQQQASTGLRSELDTAQAALTQVQQRLALRSQLENSRNAAREALAGLKLQNEQLLPEMEDLKSRIERLKAAGGADCPLCGQPLSPEHRKSTLRQLQEQGKQKGDLFRLNAASMKKLTAEIGQHEGQLAGLGTLEDQRLQLSGNVSQLTERKLALDAAAQQWNSAGKPRLTELTKLLDAGKYASDLQRELARIDKALAKLGYDASAHDAARRHAADLRSTEEDKRRLAEARAISGQIEDELRNLAVEVAGRQQEIDGQEAQFEAASSALLAAESVQPDLDRLELELRDLREQENQARDEVGAARQKVEVLKTLRVRLADHASLREQRVKQVAQYRSLERAFGKEGVPALLIEQALPQLETKANELLDRLSDGQLGIRFVTQAEYKDKKREDRKETLDILISDGAGTRDYEMYSGGEAFRINFAIRLALSEILAQRKGARLQTLVIDEGFGSQDAQGRQRLLEAINLVRSDFAKILVITHMDELKDAFPTRIEVEKTERGSTLHLS
jgi:exonuclease SbcC